MDQRRRHIDPGMALPGQSAEGRCGRRRSIRCHVPSGRSFGAPRPAHARRPHQRVARADDRSLLRPARPGRYGRAPALCDRTGPALRLRIHGVEPGGQVLVPPACARSNGCTGLFRSGRSVSGGRRRGSSAETPQRPIRRSARPAGSHLQRRQPVHLPGVGSTRRRCYRQPGQVPDDGRALRWAVVWVVGHWAAG